ncbi:MAG: hypothetical protein RR515_02790 [Clostridium sp.]
MFCYNCGNKMESAMLFCDNCGVRAKEGSEKDTTNDSDKGSSSNNLNDSINIDMEDIKNKFKNGAKEIRKSGTFNTVVKLFKAPLTTGLEVTRNSSIKDISILGLVFLVIGVLSLIISYIGLAGNYYGMEYFFEMLFSKSIIGFILIYILSIIISTLVTSLFLKVGNADDILRKALAISIITCGVSSIIGLANAILINISIIIAGTISIIGFLLYLNLYFAIFMENINVSKDIKLIIPVISISFYIGILVFVGAEVISRQAFSGVQELINLYNYF